MGGTIGFAGVGDDFWVAVRVLGEDVSLFLSDLTAAVNYGAVVATRLRWSRLVAEGARLESVPWVKSQRR